MKFFTSLWVLALTLSIVSFAAAANLTILQTSGTGPVTYDSTTGILSATDVPITADLLQNGTQQNASFSFSADVDTTGVQSGLGGLLLADDVSNLQFSITNGGTNVLSGTAASANLTDFDDSFSLSAQNPTFNQGVSFTSDIFDTSADVPDSLQINFSNSSDINGDPASATGDGNITSFSAELGPSSFTADVSPATVTTSTTPLPLSALSGMMLFGVMGLTQLGRQWRGYLTS